MTHFNPKWQSIGSLCRAKVSSLFIHNFRRQKDILPWASDVVTKHNRTRNRTIFITSISLHSSQAQCCIKSKSGPSKSSVCVRARNVLSWPRVVAVCSTVPFTVAAQAVKQGCGIVTRVYAEIFSLPTIAGRWRCENLHSIPTTKQGCC